MIVVIPPFSMVLFIQVLALRYDSFFYFGREPNFSVFFIHTPLHSSIRFTKMSSDLPDGARL